MLIVLGSHANAKSITSKNKAGYVAEMTVMYMQNQKVGNYMVPLPKAVLTGKIALSASRTIQLPDNLIYKPGKINVWIAGVGTGIEQAKRTWLCARQYPIPKW